MDERLTAFAELLHIMDELRAKCPWDKQQTLESLRHLTIEETYELADAILDNNLLEIKNELGDLMLHIAFYAKIGSELGAFNMADVLNGINTKLISRHPHVYGEVHVDNQEQVKENWEKIKLREGKKNVLSGVPRSLPAVVKERPEQVWEKVLEELNELKEEVHSGASPQKIEEEFGDLMFALINYARFIGVNPENALERTNKKFIRRFEYLEAGAKHAGKDLSRMNLAEMDVFWNEAKQQE